jgi:hypothetical protein
MMLRAKNGNINIRVNRTIQWAPTAKGVVAEPELSEAIHPAGNTTCQAMTCLIMTF